LEGSGARAAAPEFEAKSCFAVACSFDRKMSQRIQTIISGLRGSPVRIDGRANPQPVSWRGTDCGC
jgi:hypothetical protein